jgi:hypothetical protein
MDKIIQIDYNIFKECLDNQTHELNLCPKLLIIKEKLKKKYQCFFDTFDYQDILLEKKKTLISKTQLHLLNSDLSEKGKSIKVFRGFLNKITNENKANLIIKIEAFIKSDSSHFEILIEFIKKHRKSLDIYIEIIEMFNNEYVLNKLDIYWIEFIDKKGWIVPLIYTDIDIYSNMCDYETFCNFNKWKEEICSYLELWIKYKSDKLNLIIESIINTFDIELKRHIVDTMLEFLLVLKKFISNENMTIFVNLDLAGISSSTRFKIEALQL